MHNSLIIKAQLVDIEKRTIYPAALTVVNGKIESITRSDDTLEPALPFVLPGFVDAHVHIESSMLTPAQFARLAVVHGTVATVSDPHEIANVCGIEGVEFMIENGSKVPFYFNFGAPSCVPATIFETAGADLNAAAVDKLLQRKEIKYLSEMMNFPGVLHKDAEVLAKIAAAKKYNKPVDGHAPGLRGEDAAEYIAAGISTDHECFTLEEAEEKLQLGMTILIREGSAAKNFEALIPLLNTYPEKIMFCSDDKHPDSLAAGHINELCARAVAKGINIYNILQAACINPVKHYQLDNGLLQPGDNADFILVKDLISFEVIATYIKGNLVAENGRTLIPEINENSVPLNNFNCCVKKPTDFLSTSNTNHPVIEALDGQLITLAHKTTNGDTNTEEDILKIVVVNRYYDAPIAIARIKNFGLKKGAIASSVAHDSHNIVAVGTNDDDICNAVNIIIKHRGGVSLADKELIQIVPLPVAGIMSNDNGYEVAKAYSAIDNAAKSLGSELSSPYMTLSFMALLVIPNIKLSDKGLFNGETFQFYA